MDKDNNDNGTCVYFSVLRGTDPSDATLVSGHFINIRSVYIAQNSGSSDICSLKYTANLSRETYVLLRGQK